MDKLTPTSDARPRGQLTVQLLAMPADTNANGDIFGGWVVSQMDIACGIAARDASQGRAKAARREAEDFLKAELSDGPRLATEVREAAKANGISDRTLDRVKKELGVRASKDEYQGKWQWALSS